MKINNTPVRTSKNFGINNIEFDELVFSKKIKEFDNCTISGDVDCVEISENTKNIPLTYGVHKELEAQVYDSANKKIVIEQTKLKDKNIFIEFNFDEENLNLIDNIEIETKPNSKATIVIKYLSDDKERYYHNGIIKVNANEKSKTNVVIVNMMNNKSNNFISIENNIEDEAIVNYTIIDLGGKNSISNYFSNLIGKNSKSDLNSIYLGTKNQLFDINYIAELRGEKSKANIEVQGALNDNAKKNFKGTIDFKKGCKKAVGDENEFCVLLSDTAKSKALPMLLCTEEDVEGSHSTAAGKPEEDILFYIMSRGFSYKEALKLIVKANFDVILKNIKDEELKQLIIDEIDRKLN